MGDLLADVITWVWKMERVPGTSELVPREGWTIEECEQRRARTDGMNPEGLAALVARERDLEELRG
jgi:hypothetical protein